jgi:hypothetical protein
MSRPSDLILVRHDRPEIGKCFVCGTVFFEGEEQSAPRHMGKCAKRNLDDLRAELDPKERWKGSAMDPNSWDPEVAEYLRGVGDRMLAEGRLESKPNERVD